MLALCTESSSSQAFWSLPLHCALPPVPPPRPTPSSLPACPPSDSVDEFWSGWYGDLQLWQLPVTKKKAGRVLQTHSPLFRL